MVVIVGVLFLWLLPTHLFPVLEKAGVELPLPTIIVMSFVDFLTGNIIQIILTIILLIVGFFVINKTKGGKYFFHKTYLKIPIIGDLMKKFYMAQFATIFYTSMTSGVSMVESLNMTKKVVGNVVYKESISDFRERIKEGEVLSAAVKKYPLLYSSMFIQMLMVGEKTGLIERSLNNICDIYSEEIDRKIKIGISLMEPAIIIFLAVIVLVIVLSVFLPIIQMTTM
jgi:type IV pilus assembly protein PilC